MRYGAYNEIAMLLPPLTIGRMGRKRTGDRHATKMFSVRLPKPVMDKLRAIADKNRRTITAELIISLEKHFRDEDKKPSE